MLASFAINNLIGKVGSAFKAPNQLSTNDLNLNAI